MKNVKRVAMLFVTILATNGLMACSSSSQSSIANNIDVQREKDSFTLNADVYADGEMGILYIETSESQDIELSYELTPQNGDIVLNVLYPSADSQELFSSEKNTEGQLNIQLKKGMNIFEVSGSESEYKILLKGKGYDDSLITFLDFASPEQQLPES